MEPAGEPRAIQALLRLLHATVWRVPPSWRRRLGRLAAFQRFERFFFDLLGERVVQVGDDFLLVVDLSDFNQRAHFRNPHVEAHVVKYLQEHLQPGFMAVDVGAFCGYYTALMATLVSPEGAVFAIDPSPAHAERVRRQVALNGFKNVTVIEAGAADTAGTNALALKGPSSHLLQRGDDFRGHTLQVELMTLDSLYISDQRDTQWVIKLDVEGGELSVLRGMALLLASRQARVVVEVNSADLDQKIRAFISQFPVSVRMIGRSFHGSHLAIEPSFD